MMFEGKHIHYSPTDNKPLCSYSVKVCKQRRLKDYAFCIRHILEDKSAPFRQCSHYARYNNQKCTNPIPTNEDRKFCNSHMQVAGILPKKERKIKKEKDKESIAPNDSKLKFADRLKALLKKENNLTCDEDTEDPYAFPDPISENGTELYSSNPSKSIGNCYPKTSEVVIAELNKLEQLKTNNISPDSKSKSNVPKLSKTMNRLQAKIAENKLLDKLKKSQESSHLSPSTPPPLLPLCKLSKSEASSPSTLSPNVKPKLIHDDTKTSLNESFNDYKSDSPSTLGIISSKQGSNPTSPLVSITSGSSVRSQDSSPLHQIKQESSNSWSSPVTHHPSPSNPHVTSSVIDDLSSSPKIEPLDKLLQRIKDTWDLQNKKKTDIYQSDYEESSSDESDDSDEESPQLYHQHWSSIWDNKIMRGLHTNIWDCRASQQRHLQKELSRHHHQLKRVNRVHRQKVELRAPLAEALITATQLYPNATAQLLLNKMKIISKPKKSHKSLGLEKHTCCYKQDCSSCTNPVLPYTRHCMKHIMYNVDQLLFEHCTAKFPDHTQCCVSVFDIRHEFPLCSEHALKRVSEEEETSLKSEPKPKKARKKPKPSALTRPPKRGKKKKKPSQVRPPSPSSLPTLSNESTNQDVAFVPAPSSLSSSEPPLPSEELASNNTNLDPELGSDLEDQFSPGSIEKTLDLPLDTVELANQASKLLEENDFTEVLNKIPDYAFTELFAENKNGDYVPTREETEALERALAAVSKDVHLAKDELAKLTGMDDIPELQSSLLDATFQDLANGHMDVNDLNSFTQVLSASIPSENSADSHLANMLASDHSHVLNGFSGMHGLPQDTSSFSLGNSFMDGAGSNSLLNSHSAALDSRFLNSLSSVVFNSDHNAYTASSNECVAHPPSSGNNSSTPSWMLNPSDLAQFSYQNGFLVGHQTPPKYPSLHPDMSLGLTTGGPPCLVDNTNSPSLQPPTSVIAQEGAS